MMKLIALFKTTLSKGNQLKRVYNIGNLLIGLD